MYSMNIFNESQLVIKPKSIGVLCNNKGVFPSQLRIMVPVCWVGTGPNTGARMPQWQH